MGLRFLWLNSLQRGQKSFSSKLNCILANFLYPSCLHLAPIIRTLCKHYKNLSPDLEHAS